MSWWSRAVICFTIFCGVLTACAFTPADADTLSVQKPGKAK